MAEPNSTNTVSLREEYRAKLFLRALGLSRRRVNDVQNIMAVVAWMRVAYAKFNNVFAIRLGIGFGSILARKGFIKRVDYYRGKDGSFLFKFPTVEKAIRAAAYIIKTARRGGTIWLLLRALQKGMGGEFLGQLQNTGWGSLSRVFSARNKLRYLASEVARIRQENRQARRLARLKYQRELRRARRIARRDALLARRPTILQPPVLRHDYLDGFEVMQFYRERHPASGTLSA